MSFVDDLALILKTTPKNAPVRAAAMRLFPPCGRCGGSGRYSFNGSHSICYGCSGNGQRPPGRKSEEHLTLTRALEAVQDGTLDLYLRRLQASRDSKNARDKVLTAWKDTGVDKMYRWVNGYETSPTFNQRDFDIAQINKKMCDAYNTVCELSFKKDVDPLDLLAAMNKALADIAAFDLELKEYVNA